jgi:hypothetical protein
MRLNKTYVFHADPGHGWLAVKRAALHELGIADKVSSYSYQKGDTVYLEEDCDMPLYLGELQARSLHYSFKESHTNSDSHIRRYEPYESNTK